VKVLTGEAKGAGGTVVGKTYFFAGRSHRIVVDFDSEDLAGLAIGDKVEIEAWGTGLMIEGFEDTRIFSISVVKVLPGYLMGVGVGRGGPEAGAWDIQSCSPEMNEEHGLEDLRFGDLVAVTDVASDWGNGVYEGPGLAVIISSRKERIDPVLDGKANIAYYLGLRKDMEW